MEVLTITTTERNQMIDITPLVQAKINESGIQNGICYVFVPHTTAAVTINENSDPDVVRDILHTLSKLVPHRDDYRHIEGNSDAHVKASLFGNTATVIVDKGRLVLEPGRACFSANLTVREGER